MTKLYKFHLTLIQLSKKKTFLSNLWIGMKRGKFQLKVRYLFFFSPPRKLCANKNKAWQEHFINHLYPRTGHCRCHICWWDIWQKACCRNTVFDLILLKISSAKIFFSSYKVLPGGHSFFLEACEVLASLALFTMETCTWIELQCMTWYKQRWMFDACYFLFILIWIL